MLSGTAGTFILSCFQRLLGVSYVSKGLECQEEITVGTWNRPRRRILVESLGKTETVDR